MEWATTSIGIRVAECLLMSYRFAFRPYQRRFRQPLQTSHGSWEMREGIILRLGDQAGREGWGEIAPLPWFGSETLEQARDFCHQLGEEVTEEEIMTIPEALPACQFAFESALENLQQFSQKCNTSYSLHSSCWDSKNFSYSCLLPTGEKALQTWQAAWENGERTFKWKIGTRPIQEELQVFDQLMQRLPTTAKLRLDANGELSFEEAQEWLRVADEAGNVEFIEQPLSSQAFEAMLELNAKYSTPLALDESVATLNQLERCYQKGWRRIFVIKAAITGSPMRLRQFCRECAIDTVFSSALETSIGRQAALKLAAEISSSNRALGFGVNHWFEENQDNWLEKLWN